MPFLLAHGGFQLQIEQTKLALEANGVEVEWLRWWDGAQTGQIIHYFGRATVAYIEMARLKGMKVVMADLLTGMGSRSQAALLAQKSLMRISERLMPPGFLFRLSWPAYRMADALVALTPWEARLLTQMFDARPEQISVVPNGVEDVFSTGPGGLRGEYLVCTAAITERKRIVELAQAAVHARVPLRVIGKPYGEQDPYFARFIALAKAHAPLLRYEGGISDRAALAGAYRAARGFVLLSNMESLSLSALEAAACGCPLLLSDLPWARTVFGAQARYCPVTRQVEATGAALRRFYDEAPQIAAPPRPLSWLQVGAQLKGLYERVLSSSR